jgi:hypothetical protein
MSSTSLQPYSLKRRLEGYWSPGSSGRLFSPSADPRAHRSLNRGGATKSETTASLKGGRTTMYLLARDPFRAPTASSCICEAMIADMLAASPASWTQFLRCKTCSRGNSRSSGNQSNSGVMYLLLMSLRLGRPAANPTGAEQGDILCRISADSVRYVPVFFEKAVKADTLCLPLLHLLDRSRLVLRRHSRATGISARPRNPILPFLRSSPVIPEPSVLATSILYRS